MNKIMKAIAAIMLTVAVFCAAGCVKDPTNVNVNENVGYDIPEVETSIVQEITETTAIGGGVVTSSAGGSIIERGLCCGTQANPTVGGNHVVEGTGAGTFYCQINNLEPNTTYHVRAYAINSVGIGYGDDAVFTTLGENGGGNGQIELPEGAINGIFSVGNGKKVCFSKGNLQYNKTTQDWSFMNNQYDIVERDGQVVGTDYCNQNLVSLFGPGTSGYVNRYPYLTTASSFYPTDDGRYDWGVYNSITNGGNQAWKWRTIHADEWSFIINYRMTSSGIRYAKAIVNGVNGLVLLPDDWSSSIYTLNQTNIHDASFNSNRISASQWSVLENAGAVFLPAAGSRIRTTVQNVGSNGIYWCRSIIDDMGHFTWCSTFYSNDDFDSFNSGYNEVTNGFYGYSVRLVCTVDL